MHDLRALVVDDSKVGRLTMSKKLEAIGVKVDMTESGQQALDYLNRQRPDLIFMDYMMPEMDGFEVTRRIKASPATRDIPVIIVSGSDDASFVAQALAIGAINVITKPPVDGVLETILGSLPTAATSAAAEPVPAPSLDRAGVHLLVEQLLAGAMQPLHDSLMADVEKRMAREFERQHRPQLDLDAVLVNIDQRIASGLAEFQARTERQEAQWEGQRQALLARLGDQSAQVEQRIGGLGGRLDALSADVGQRLGNAQSAQAALAQRFSAVDQRLRAIEGAEASPALDAEALLAAVDAHITTRLAATMASPQLPTQAIHASEKQAEQPLDGAGNAPLQAEVDQLHAKVRTLTLTLAIGMAVLLAAIATHFLRG